jgi:hypothetical protein
MSRAWLATMRFNRTFSFWSSFNNLASSAFMPPNWLCQRCQVDDAKLLKELQKENVRLKRIVANQALDIDMLKFVAEGKFGSPAI